MTISCITITCETTSVVWFSSNDHNHATCVVRSDEDIAQDPDWTHWWGNVHTHEAFGDCDYENIINNYIIASRIVFISSFFGT